MLEDYHDAREKEKIILRESVPMSLSPILGEISEGINSLHEHNKRQDDKTDAILAQVQKTNGRVSKIEIWKAKIEGGGKALGGLWAVVGVLVIAGIFGIFGMYSAIQKLPMTIHAEVQDQLDDYQISIIDK